MTTHSARLNEAQKRDALRRALESDTLARADQLKQLLTYVCEMEILGRSSELTEFRIAEEALGKGKDFSPVDDASVRNRVYALRSKLERLYAVEDPGAPIKIELIRGTYIPRFAEANVDELPAPPPRELLEEPPAEPAPRFRRPIVWLLGGLVSGMAIMALFQRAVTAPARSIDPIVREAWGTLLDRKDEVLISLGAPAQMTLLPFDVKMEWDPELPAFEAPAAIYPWYVRQHRFFSGRQLYMTPDVNSPHFGDVLGATIAIKTLSAAGCAYRLLPERVVPAALLNARNSILFGVPYKSEAVLKALEKTPFQFTYDAKLRDVVITRSMPGGAPPKIYTPRRDERNDRVESFGLITVVRRDPDDAKGGTVVVFSGDPSAGAAAAATFFVSPQHLSEVRERLRAEGYERWPAAYQILVRCRLDSNLLLSLSYEAHAVLRAR